MKFNDRGPDVETLQGKLLRLGYALPQFGADGHLGAETWAVLQQHAQDRKLPWAPEVPDHVLADIEHGSTTRETRLSAVGTDDSLDGVRLVHLEHEARDPHPKSRIVSGKTVRRRPEVVDGVCLHQMAVEITPSAALINEAVGDYGLAWARRALGVAAQICVYDDLIACTTPLDWYMYAANRLNNSTISVEVSGVFSGLLDDPDTPPREDLRTTWGQAPPMELAPARLRGARRAVRYAVEAGRRQGMPIKYIYAHRQSNGGKPGDPGEALWRGVVIDYAVPVLGLIPRYDFTVDEGRPIPKNWDPRGVGSYR